MLLLHPEERCRYCYSVRLEATAREAKRSHFDSFSTTLLYSIYQKHDLIKEMGERIAEEVGISFHYEDFRRGWRKGVEVSKAMGLYRQQYCGCIYSEKERFMKIEEFITVEEDQNAVRHWPTPKLRIPTPHVLDGNLP